jgi:hypothetical protein
VADAGAGAVAKAGAGAVAEAGAGAVAEAGAGAVAVAADPPPEAGPGAVADAGPAAGAVRTAAGSVLAEAGAVRAGVVRAGAGVVRAAVGVVRTDSVRAADSLRSAGSPAGRLRRSVDAVSARSARLGPGCVAGAGSLFDAPAAGAGSTAEVVAERDAACAVPAAAAWSTTTPTPAAEANVARRIPGVRRDGAAWRRRGLETELGRIWAPPYALHRWKTDGLCLTAGVHRSPYRTYAARLSHPARCPANFPTTMGNSATSAECREHVDNFGHVGIRTPSGSGFRPVRTDSS